MPHSRTFVGIENLGSTCYINSCIQILFYTDEINDILKAEFQKEKEKKNGEEKEEKDEKEDKEEKEEKDEKEEEKEEKEDKEKTPDYILTREWLELLKEMSRPMTQEKVVVSPKRFIHYLQKVSLQKNRPEFSGHEQNDFAEFLYFLIDTFHNSISKSVHINVKGKSKTRQDHIAKICYDYLKPVYKKEYSKIFQNFFGLTVSEIIQSEENILSTKPEHFFMLDLEIPTVEQVNLYHCMDCYVSGEILTGSNAWYNEKTNAKETVTKRLSFWHFPDIFIVCLKRFHISKKNDTLVRFPLNGLDLSPYVCGYDAPKYKYNLYATCNHYGTSSYGHYVANILHENMWVCFNDQHVKRVDKLEDIYIGAYCLFYRRIP